MFLTFIILSLSLIAGCTPSPAPDNIPENTAPTPEPEPAEEEKDELEAAAGRLLEKMTLEEKVGQLLIVGFQQDIDEASLQEYFDKYRVSGFILFSRNYKDFNSLYSLVESLKEKNSLSSSIPLFISIDEEGGTVSRLPEGGTHFPEALKLGRTGDPGLTRKAGRVIGSELKAAGINLDFAPVLDVVTDSGNKLLVKRSYGSSADTVAGHGLAFMEGLQSEGVIAVPKHFPGHGNTVTDSHSELPVIDTDRELLEKRELAPFKAAVGAGADVLMVGHIAFPKLDPSGLPATMSGYFITDILRKDLGFKGIAISDDIEMSGYTKAKAGLEEGVIASFEAGLDVFLIGHTKEIGVRVYEALRNAVQKGEISEERLNESVMRVLRVKLKHKLSDTMEYSLEEASEIFGSEEHKAILKEINEAIR